jgi:hypothetical protein
MMTLPGSGGATGVAAAGSTPTTVGVGDGATSAVAAAIVAVADPALDTNDRAEGPGDSGSTAGCTSASAATFARCTVCVSPFPDDGVGSDNAVVVDDGVGSGDAAPADGVELVDTMTSGDELVDALVDPGVEETGVVSLSAGAVGDVLVDSAAAVGLVRWLVEDEPYVVCFVCDGLVDTAVGDSPGSCVEVDGLLDGPSVDVLGPRLASEPVPLLDEEEPLGLSEPVPSA